LQKIIRKYVDLKWNKEEREYFDKIKNYISNTPILRSLDFSHDFILYTFAFDHYLVVILTQKDIEGDEAPISFMSTILQGVELNYPAIDKKSFVVFKVSRILDHTFLKTTLR
jgi:hypothetical protein